MRRLRHRRRCGGDEGRLPSLGRGALPLLCFIWLLAASSAAAQDEVTIGSTKSDKEVEYGEPTEAHTDGRDLPKSNETLERRITVLLDEMLKSHDKRIRPNYGGPPVEVNITALITTISAVSEVSMDYTLDLYLRQIWRDDRLAFPSETPMSLTIGIDMVNQIWTPDTFFPNEKKSFFHEATSHNSFLRIDNHGNVLRSIRLTVTANCPMSLHTFPLDTQQCALEIESYGYSTKDIVYHWHNNESLKMEHGVYDGLAHFTVGKHFQIEREISTSTGSYSRLTAIFNFKRNIGFYLIQIYFPSSLIVVISWVSFWLNREAVQARVAIGVTTVLTMTTLMTSTNGSLPKVSYVKSLDIFLGVCFFIVFASLVEYAAVGYMIKRHRLRLANGTSAPSPVTYFESETSPNLQPANGRMRNGSNRLRRNNNRSAKSSINIPMDHLDAEHIVPLLVAVPVTRRPRFTFRPAQVDLASRILFPLFFVVFQIIYWYWYFFSTMGSEYKEDRGEDAP
ncbi:hypothetical protein PENTCL1PPCAC_30588 [Pristionchus entomophagus]|uniref:Gamma-aminobutyric acid receptor subunit beta n=1 Tax=Pristionchus entomophagus TaxID=358040 RepID=A0AAV5UQ26_9BILA|nr:hypothetical protein PENTCL1PPCAC_10022 [Pristionchus entomophagus]GMT08414.1 hypothetical protein PENTCL1PPCAC_30588 [Pristionchus entomophagus]